MKYEGLLLSVTAKGHFFRLFFIKAINPNKTALFGEHKNAKKIQELEVSSPWNSFLGSV
jgi:hypothetical protein